MRFWMKIWKHFWSQQNDLINHFDFLCDYGFKIEFLSFEKDSAEYIKMNTMVALIHNEKDNISFNELINNKGIDMIFCASGGDYCISSLEYIDFDTLRIMDSNISVQ